MPGKMKDTVDELRALSDQDTNVFAVFKAGVEAFVGGMYGVFKRFDDIAVGF